VGVLVAHHSVEMLHERGISMADPQSWKLACKTKSCTNGSYNALRFKTKEACLAYGADLHSRWLALDKYEAHPSDDEANR